MTESRRRIALNRLGELRNIDATTYQIIQELQNQINRYIFEQGLTTILEPGGGTKVMVAETLAGRPGNITGTIDGVNPDFVLPVAPSSSRILLIRDLLKVIGGVDYYRVGADIHFVSAAAKPTSSLFAMYPYDGPDDGGGAPEEPPPTGTANVWTLESIDAVTWADVAFSPTLGLFAVVSNSTGKIATSPDGETWTVYLTIATTLPWTSITWGNGRFLLVQNAGGGAEFVGYSTDGITWSAAGAVSSPGPGSGGAFFQSVRHVLWIEELSLYVSDDGDRYWSSADGIHWTQRAGYAGFLNAGFAWSPALGVAVAIGNGYLATSTDGVNWTEQTSPWGVQPMKDVCWSPELGIFLACGGPKFFTSPDGINWAETAAPASREYLSVVWSAARRIFVAATTTDSAAKFIAWSADGVNWTEVLTPTTSPSTGWNLLGVADSPDIVVAFASPGSGRTDVAARCLA